ncbi:membrane protein involved in the export of O-antigen and teichoic acid [Halovivax ruber XH-70]|uniref:Membrane protein involved in the export of O-antigen and teichoic acid n=1 Tax=Halovivax ruber (strain DSM 18193 / JCM 13892 / XH-70) TaxID=797302 RepID=L0I5T4_HALRX|nr:flippase [Halovivax ruber]AGB14875.1 membrane protein involved in the export of O-antigen and teichoic acid [Halovivax ruber XH-70]
MSLRRTLLERFQFEFVARLVGSISGGLLAFGLARILSTDEYGLLFLAISVFSVVELLSRLGVPKAGARYITLYREKDPAQVPGLLRYTFVLNVGLALVASGLLFVGAGPIARVVGESTLEPLLQLGSVFVAATAVFKFARIELQAFEDIDSAAIVYSIERASRAVIALTLAVLGFGAVGALVGYVVAAVVGGLLGAGILYRTYLHGTSVSAIDAELRRRVLSYSVPITATTAANRIDNKLDTILVGVFLDPTAVAFYTLPGQIREFVQTPVAAVGFSLSPTFESQKAGGNADRAARMYEQTIFYVLLLYIPAATGMAIVAEPFITIVFGSEYAGAVPVLQILAIHIVLVAVAIVTSNSLDYLGRARERAIAKTVTALCNLGLNVLLIPTIGVVGAAIATVLTFSVYTAVAVYIMGQELDLRSRWLAARVGKIVLVTAVMVPGVYGILSLGDGLFTLGLAVIGGVAIWLGSSLSLNLIRTEDVKSYL